MQLYKIKITLCTLKIELHKVKLITLNKYGQAYL